MKLHVSVQLKVNIKTGTPTAGSGASLESCPGQVGKEKYHCGCSCSESSRKPGLALQPQPYSAQLRNVVLKTLSLTEPGPGKLTAGRGMENTKPYARKPSVEAPEAEKKGHLDNGECRTIDEDDPTYEQCAWP